MKRKIGWQKYEDVIDTQVNSPVLDAIYKKAFSNIMSIAESIADEDYDEDEEEINIGNLIRIDPKVAEMATLSTTFDCWMGHSNFNLTESIEERLKKINGVEILKICSRYRFFIGVGKMFEFSQVRRDIQKELSIESDDETTING